MPVTAVRTTASAHAAEPACDGVGMSVDQAAAALFVTVEAVADLVRRGDLSRDAAGRLPAARVAAYKREVDAARERTLAELARESQELGLGY